MTLYCQNCGKKVGSRAKHCPQCGEDLILRPPMPEPAEQIMVEVSLKRPPFDTVPLGCFVGCLADFVIALLVVSTVWHAIEKHLHGSVAQAAVAHLLPVFGLPAILTGTAAILLRKSRPHAARGFVISTVTALVLGILVFFIVTSP
jgi:hypothetical protein